MNIIHVEWWERLVHWMRVLKQELYEPLGEISWEACRTKEHLSIEEVLLGNFIPVSQGFTWGEQWEYCWFKSSIVLPEAAEGKRIVLNLEPGGESTLFVNGKSFGTYRSDQVAPIHEKHHYFEDNILTRQAKSGEQFDIMMETYAGHYYPEPVIGCAYGPVIPGMYENTLPEGARRTLGKCTYGIWNEDAYQLYMDVETLMKLFETIDETSLRAAKIAEALEQFTLIVDFEQDREKRNACYREAIEKLRPVMEAENGSTMPVFYAIGNAHIDLAWLWPMAETKRKTARTFAAQLRLLEEYPEYKFIQSQPAAYEMCRKYYPELFERIKEAVKGGQWIAEGAMWVEPDTNIAGGEALIRQLLYGKKYYKEVFDVDSQVLWLPDTFGYTAALPQILKGCGIKYLVTQKIFWSYNQGEQFPYHYFKWKGMDGSEIVSFLPTSYTYKTDPMELNHVWKNRCQARDLDAFLLPYGYGDGGGGPSRDHIEYARRQKNLEGSVKVKFSEPIEFFEDMQEKGGPKNTYVGELYFTAHRGTYTSQAMVKKNNRKSELAMRDLELWSALASLEEGNYPKTEIEELWKEVLLYQFHDILPGTCIAKVYEEVEEGYVKLLKKADNLQKTAQEKLLTCRKDESAVTVFNSLGFDRKVIVSLPDAFENGAVLADGRYLPVAVDAQGVKTLLTLPSCGSVSLRPATSKAVKNVPSGAAIVKTENGFTMENAFIRAVVNERGEVVSFILKESGREFAAGSMNGFHIYKDVPRVFDAWDIDSHYIEQEVDGIFDVTVEEMEQGMEAVLKVTGKISESTYAQYIRLSADSRRLEFETEVEWKELHRLLKVAFPVNVYTENAINEMQFGYVERPAHRSRLYDKDRFEVCNHRYSAFCDGAHGAAVLNDSKYGISMNDNRLELTLLRAAASPVMRADNGVHHFTYAFTAWEGSFANCDVVRQAYELNVKPVVVQGGCLDMSFLQIEQTNVMLDTIKLAEDGSGDVIVRLYEAKKAAVTANIYVELSNMKAYACDMLENVIEELTVVDGTIEIPFRAFEIKTIRLVKEEKYAKN